MTMLATIQLGDCRDIIAELPDCSVDSIVTDPPYELGFMGKQWDGSGIAYDPTLWAQCLRVLRPGGHLLAFGGTRTYHRMAVAIEDAGFEIRDSIHWLYGSGFPKSLNVSKAIDKAAGAERAVIGQTRRGAQSSPTNAYGAWGDGITETAPATDAARQWEGWGTALKPAHEPILVARKPLSGTVAATVLEHGTGALNIDGCRIGTDAGWSYPNGPRGGGVIFGIPPMFEPHTATAGRWPANLILTHAADCATDCATDCPVAEIDRQSGVSRSATDPITITKSGTGVFNRTDGGMFDGGRSSTFTPFGDTGGASRFFTVTEWDPIADVAPFRYVPKPSRAERDAGLDAFSKMSPAEMTSRVDGSAGLNSPRAGAGRSSGGQNHHPTVKPLALMRWLVRLVTPPGGTVLEPFAGSGTTMAAAILEDRHVIGCELTADYLPIIEGRIAWARRTGEAIPPTLFDEVQT